MADPTPGPDRPTDPWYDLNDFVASPRLGDLVLDPDGQNLLVGVSAPNAEGTAYVTSWWRVDPTGETAARRWTRAVEGDGTAAFTGEGDLLFTSKRRAPPGEPGESDDDVGVLWCLPRGGGEAYALARRRGGWSGVLAAARGDRMVLSADASVASADEPGHTAIAADRAKRKVTAILHERYPVRYWDHDLGATDVRVLSADLAAVRNPTGDYAPAADAWTDLTPSRGCFSGELGGSVPTGRRPCSTGPKQRRPLSSGRWSSASIWPPGRRRCWPATTPTTSQPARCRRTAG